MRKLLEHSILAGIGLLSITHEKTRGILNELTRRGEVQKDDAKDWIESLVQRGKDEHQGLRKLIRDEVKSVLDEFGLITKEDLQNLNSKMDTLYNQSKT